ncbi:hypothetical protein ACHAWC_003882, partial [Mediolabrus comicus]
MDSSDIDDFNDILLVRRIRQRRLAERAGNRDRSDEESLSDDDNNSSDEEEDDGDEEEQEYINAAQDAIENLLRRVRENDPGTVEISSNTEYGQYFKDMSGNQWEQLGLGISSNNHVRELELRVTLNDETMSSLFRGLTGSNSIKEVRLNEYGWMLLHRRPNNGFGVEGARSMLPFLQNASNLTSLNFTSNNIGSEGFNLLWRALRDSPIEQLYCGYCGIESIEIDGDHIPNNLRHLFLNGNRIDTDDCYELAKLLQGRQSMLNYLDLDYNNIGDEGITVLANVLQSNTSLQNIRLRGNKMIRDEGMASLLKLVNDISSIKATLNSNHTLHTISVDKEVTNVIQRHIHAATKINRENRNNTVAAGRAKVIHTQLNSAKRAELAHLQGVDRSLYLSEIDNLHLPEVLALVGKSHGHAEFFLALQASVTGLISTVN